MEIRESKPKEPWLKRYMIYSNKFNDLLLLVSYLISHEYQAFSYSVIFGDNNNCIIIDCNCLIIEELLEEFEAQLQK